MLPLLLQLMLLVLRCWSCCLPPALAHKSLPPLCAQTCGITSFYRPRSNPTGYAVTAACITSPTGQRPGCFSPRTWDLSASG